MKHWRETKEIVSRVIALAADGRRAAIATVVQIEGSSYRRTGARFLIQDDGLTCGGVRDAALTDLDAPEDYERVNASMDGWR